MKKGRKEKKLNLYTSSYTGENNGVTQYIEKLVDKKKKLTTLSDVSGMLTDLTDTSTPVVWNEKFIINFNCTIKFHRELLLLEPAWHDQVKTF